MDGGHPVFSYRRRLCPACRNSNCIRYLQCLPLDFTNAPFMNAWCVETVRTTTVRTSIHISFHEGGEILGEAMLGRASNHIDLTLSLGTSPPTAQRERQTQNNSGVLNSQGPTLISIAMESGRTGAGVPVRAAYAVENPNVDLTLGLGSPGSNLNNLAEAELIDSTSTEAVIVGNEEGEVVDTQMDIEFLSVPPHSGADQPAQ